MRAYLGNIYEADPDLPENRDQNIQYYEWDDEANTWLNNFGDEPAPAKKAQTLSFWFDPSTAHLVKSLVKTTFSIERTIE